MARGNIIIHANRTYSTISNYHIRDKELTLKAIGLLTKLLTMPPEWDYTIAGLVSICKESKNTIKAILKELKTAGYLEIEKINPRQGQKTIKYVWHIYEKPAAAEMRNDFTRDQKLTPTRDQKSNACKLTTNNKYNNKYKYIYINNINYEENYNRHNIPPEQLEDLLT